MNEKTTTLEELLSNTTKEDFLLTDEDREWLDMKPVGKEVLDEWTTSE